jgi:ribonucleotide monophosphatase NagD (HAD superfamily)
MPGTLAKWYKDMGGGSVHLMGKPSSIIYEEAIGRLGGVERKRVLAVGDSMEHDIAG